jgi:hypothetical protein
MSTLSQGLTANCRYLFIKSGHSQIGLINHAHQSIFRYSLSEFAESPGLALMK